MLRYSWAVPTLTTEQVADALGVSRSTVLRWARIGILPPPAIIHRGRWGRNVRWADHAIEQGRWVLLKLQAGASFEEIAAALEAGEFLPQSPAKE